MLLNKDKTQFKILVVCCVDSLNVCYILSDRRPLGQGASQQEPQNLGHFLCETPRALPSQSPKKDRIHLHVNSENLKTNKIMWVTIEFSHLIISHIYATYMSDMSLEVFQSKGAHNKPEFERTETSTQGNLPMLDNMKEL